MKKLYLEENEINHENLEKYGIIKVYVHKNKFTTQRSFLNKTVNVYNVLINMSDQDIETRYFYMVKNDVRKYSNYGDSIIGYYIDKNDCVLDRKRKFKRLLDL